MFADERSKLGITQMSEGIHLIYKTTCLLCSHRQIHSAQGWSWKSAIVVLHLSFHLEGAPNHSWCSFCRRVVSCHHFQTTFLCSRTQPVLLHIAHGPPKLYWPKSMAFNWAPCRDFCLHCQISFPYFLQSWFTLLISAFTLYLFLCSHMNMFYWFRPHLPTGVFKVTFNSKISKTTSWPQLHTKMTLQPALTKKPPTH